MNTELNTTNVDSSLSDDHTTQAMHQAGQIANRYAAQSAFADYTSRKAHNTVMAQFADLAQFCEFLASAGIVGAPSAEKLQTEPSVWRGVSWGIIDAFVKWQLDQGHAISSINRRLSTVKTYSKLAAQAGTIDSHELALIKTVTGYGKTEAKRVNAKRSKTRIGGKKVAPVRLTPEQAKQLKRQPDTPQGRRDALLMCLLLEHGLRVGEVAALQVANFDLPTGIFTFERPKVDGLQTHRLTADTLRALYAWVHSGDCPTSGSLLRESLKDSSLTEAGVSERAIQFRVKLLGEQLGIIGLSPHDCRHYWATYWAGKVDVLRLQEAGGWSSLAMPRRYIERAEIANEGMA